MIRMKVACTFFLAAATLLAASEAFLPRHAVPNNIRIQATQLQSVMTTDDDIVRDKSFVMTDDEVNPIFRIGEGEKEKIINGFGLWCVAVTLMTCPFWLMAMGIVNMICDTNENLDPNRSVYDKTGKIWSKIWLSMTNSFPTASGDVLRLKEGQGPCLYVANHASWLDIPVLCTVLDPVFKFIAKGELRSVPCIGQQLSGGKHILIDRSDRRSQLRTFKEGLNYLKNGVPVMAFPEGARSRDGRLMKFKGGLFAMAVKAKVPIVPLTISHTHAVMPANSLFPVQNGCGKLHVHVHDAIDAQGKTEAELEQLVRKAFLSALPLDQLPNSNEDCSVDEDELDQVAQRAANLPVVQHHQPLHVAAANGGRSTAITVPEKVEAAP